MFKIACISSTPQKMSAFLSHKNKYSFFIKKTNKKNYSLFTPGSSLIFEICSFLSFFNRHHPSAQSYFHFLSTRHMKIWSSFELFWFDSQRRDLHPSTSSPHFRAHMLDHQSRSPGLLFMTPFTILSQFPRLNLSKSSCCLLVLWLTDIKDSAGVPSCSWSIIYIYIDA